MELIQAKIEVLYLIMKVGKYERNHKNEVDIPVYMYVVLIERLAPQSFNRGKITFQTFLTQDC